MKAATEEMSSSDKPLQMETNRVHCALSRLVIVAIVIVNIIVLHNEVQQLRIETGG